MDLSFCDQMEVTICERIRRDPQGFVPALDGRIHFKKGLVMDIPWVFIRGRDNGDCYLYKDIYFQTFKIIPSYCMDNCWKITIAPRTVKELFETYEALKQLDFPSKCGIEEREYVKRLYGAYIYCLNPQEAAIRIEEAKKLLPEGIPMKLKRGCTEFEHLMPSNQWVCTPEQKAFEQKLEAIFNPVPLAPFQSQWIKNNVKRRWVQWAHDHGDHTYKEFVPEAFWPKDVVYPESVTYDFEEVTEPQKGEGDGQNK